MEVLSRNDQLSAIILDKLDKATDPVLFADLLITPECYRAAPLNLLRVIAMLAMQKKIDVSVMHDRNSARQFVIVLPGRDVPYQGEDWYMTEQSPENLRKVATEAAMPFPEDK